MKVVFVGNDKSIVTGENGDSRERMHLYARRLEKLSIILFSLVDDQLSVAKGNQLAVFPTNSVSRWHYVFDAMKILSRIDFDLISTQDPFIAGCVGVLAKLLWHKKLNIQIHNDFFVTKNFRSENLQNFLFYLLGKLNLIFADSVRVVSSRIKERKKDFVAPVATNLEFFWHKPHVKRFNQIVCVARLSRQKNLPMLIQATEELGKDLVIVGDGEERQNLPQKYLVGQKTATEVKNIYNQSDLFVLPSNYEGWGISVIEALASGLPIVMTDTGCAGEVILDKKTGLVCPIGNKEQLMAKIRWADGHVQKSQKLVQAGQKLLREKYTREHLVTKFIDGLRNT